MYESKVAGEICSAPGIAASYPAQLDRKKSQQATRQAVYI